MNRWIVRSLALGILAILLLVGLKQEARAQQEPDQGPSLDQTSDLTSYQGLDVLPHLEGSEPAPNAQAAQNPNAYAPYSAITFQSARDQHDWEIILGDYSGGNQIRLTWNEVGDIHPRLNRGCTEIVYASFQPSKNYNIFTMNSDGSGVTQLTGNNKDDVFPAWSPDGTKIAFQAYRDGNPEIYIMNADGSNQTRLTNSPGFDGTPAWSPDGRIVFASNRGGTGGIWVMNADGSGLTQLAGQANSTLPAWSPDGSQIAYSADNNGDGWMELWLMNADGSNPQQLISYGSPYDALARSWSPDGRYIAFTKVGWVIYHGNWYWTVAYLTAWDTQTHYVEEITPDDTEWYPDWQTSDGQPPVSSMTPLTSQSPATFLVSWSGYDNGPSGLKNFDVQVKDGIDGAWTDWLMATTRTSASYLGVGGHTYYFRVRARDNAWNLEGWPEAYDAMTMVENLPPQAFIKPLPDYLKRGSLIEWGGSDPGGSGISTYDVQYRDLASGDWIDFATATGATSGYFNGTVGNTFSFRVRAMDNAANQGLWSLENGATSTTLYEWGIWGTVHDNSGVPVANADVNTIPAAFVKFPSDGQGNYAAYVLDDTTNYSTTWSKDLYGTLPPAGFDNSHDSSFVVALPPVDNIIRNWGFEEGGLSPYWQTGGTYTPTLTDKNHTGQSALLLGVVPPEFSSPRRLSIGNYTFQPAQLVDNNGIVHVIWEEGGNNAQDLFYAQRNLNGSWSTPYNISGTDEGSTNAQMVMGSAGELHIVWLESEWTHAKIFYAYRSTDGNWSNSQMLFDYNYGYQGYEIEPLQLLSASNGKVYLLWSYNGRIYCATRLPNQDWSSPEIVYGPNMYFRNPRAAVDLNGTIHVTMYTSDQYGSNEGITYLQRDATGVWSYPIYLTNDFQGNFDNTGNRYTFVDRYGRVQVLWVDVRDSDMYYVIKSANGKWSEPVNISKGWSNWDGFDTTKAVKADEEGRITLAWTGGGIYISQHDVYSDWSTPINISNGTYTTNPISLFPDSHGNIHVSWDMSVYCGSNECENIYYTVQKPGEAWTDPIVLSQPNTRVFSPNIAVGLDGRVHVVWVEYEINDVWIDYVGPVTVPYSGKSILSQEFTIPVTLTSPTLSFLYQIEDASTDEGSGLSVLVNNSLITTTLLSTSINTSDWTHAWFDLSPWLSQTITLTFNIHEVEGYPYAWAYLDEVTVGSAHPDVWVSPLGARAAMPGQQVTFQLSYGNRSPVADAISATITATLPAGLIFDSASLTPTMNGNVLTWSVGDLPAGSGPFTILVIVTVAGDTAPGSTLTLPVEIATATPELKLVNNLKEYTLYIGSFVYLPVIVH